MKFRVFMKILKFRNLHHRMMLPQQKRMARCRPGMASVRSRQCSTRRTNERWAGVLTMNKAELDAIKHRLEHWKSSPHTHTHTAQEEMLADIASLLPVVLM